MTRHPAVIPFVRRVLDPALPIAGAAADRGPIPVSFEAPGKPGRDKAAAGFPG
jgi:hypothetical protein